MLPAQAAEARRWVQEGATKAGRAVPIVAAYVRVAIGPESQQRLQAAERKYRNINEAHRQHFNAMDVPLGSVGVAAATRAEALDKLAPYHAALDLQSHGWSQTPTQPRFTRRQRPLHPEASSSTDCTVSCPPGNECGAPADALDATAQAYDAARSAW